VMSSSDVDQPTVGLPRDNGVVARGPGGRDGWVLLAIMALGACLLLPNLGNTNLWQDEAETALLARSVLKHGYPLARDGGVLVTQDKGRDSNSDGVWTWHPWLQFYVTAASFSLLGESATSARVPFVLIGLANLLLLHRLVRRLFGDRRVANVACLLLATSIPFLLHVRQARWYALAMFGSTWLIYAWLKLQARERSAVLQIIAASLLLLHSNYLSFAAVWGGLALHFVHGLACGRPGPDFAPVFRAGVAVVLCTLPWLIFLSGGWEEGAGDWAYLVRLLADGFASFRYPDVAWLLLLLLVPALLWGIKRLQGLKKAMGFEVHPVLFVLAWALMLFALVYWVEVAGPTVVPGSSVPLTGPIILTVLVCVDAYVFPLPLLLGLVWIFQRGQPALDATVKNNILLLFYIVLFTLIMLSLLPWFYFRYLLTLVPVAVALAALPVIKLWDRHTFLAAAVLVILILSNGLTFTLPPRAPKFELFSYLHEITHEYIGPNKAIADFLNERGKPGQLVMTNYANLPIIFHTGMQAQIRGYQRLRKAPDWIIVRSYWNGRDPLAQIALRALSYSYEKLAVPDQKWGNRPDPFYHRYWSVEEGPPIIVFGRASDMKG